jgi:hypothetical protein
MNLRTENGGDEIDQADRSVLDSIRGMFLAHDPLPPDLGARVRFALDLAGVEGELATVCADLRLSAATRSTRQSRNVTFECGSSTVAVMITPIGHDRRRLDGWIAPGQPLRVELRQGTERLHTRADRGGRFAFADVAAGPAQVVVHLDPEGTDEAHLEVVTQTIEL